MNEEELKAMKFSEEVDALIARKRRPLHEGEGTDDNELLVLAGRLQAVDVTMSGVLQAQLRRELLQKLELKQTKHLRRWYIPQLYPSMHRRALWVMATLVVLFVLLLSTSASRSVVIVVGDIIRELRWQNTTVQQVAPDYTPENIDELNARLERELAAGRAWSFSFEGSDFGGCCADGMRHEVVSLDQAITEAGYTIQLPGFVPDGFSLTEIRLFGVPPYDVFVIFAGTGDRIGLYQASGGIIGREQVDESPVVVDARESVALTEGFMEEVAIGDITAALLDGYELVWEEDGVTFYLIGPGLDVETLIEIAESLKPTD
jgi:hypothetical protein